MVAGQIGLVPGSMKFPPSPRGSSGCRRQASLALRHASRILRARGATGVADVVQVGSHFLLGASDGVVWL